MKKFKIVISLSLILMFCGSLFAANHVVTSNADDGGTGTLRYIIANCGDGDEITFNLSSGNETIVLNSEIAIEYPGVSFDIDGANTDGSGIPVTIQVAEPGVSDYKVFMFNPGTPYTINLSNMTLKGGDVTGGTGYHTGGTIYLYNLNSCTLTNVTIEGSKAYNGGGIYVFNSPLIMNNCTILNTQASMGGGGICNGDYDGSFTLTSTTISNCSAVNIGGGLSLGCPTTASDLIVENCTANIGGGIQSSYSLNLTNSEVTNNDAGSDGGGIYCSKNGSVTINKSVISDNSAVGNGGGLYALSEEDTDQISINNSTISNNSADSDGGGIYAYSSLFDEFMGMYGDLNLVLLNSTVTGNTSGSNGAGICAVIDDGATNAISLTNSIVTYNATSSAYEDFYNSNATFYGNYNIVGDLTLSGSNNSNYSYTNGMGADLFESYSTVIENSIYKPVLADNGGNTETVALASTSIASGSGVRTGEYESSGTKYVFYNGSNWVKVEDGSSVVSSGVTEITTDQRGETRDNPTCIGTYEILAVPSLWTGATSTDWNTGSNWDDGNVPTATVDVQIPDTGNDPIISANAVCQNLTVENGATLTINSSYVLNVSGDMILNDGSSFTNSGTVQFSGADCHLSDNRTTKTDLGNISVED